ncbi:MAG: BrxA family protein [Candidatus Tectimicrobiota bacterium]
MSAARTEYTTQLGAGLGLLAETQALLELWQPEMDVTALYQTALRSGRFPTISARRLRNIVVECFAPRYLVNDGLPARLLHTLQPTLVTPALTQLLLLYTCRAHLILADFVREVYWERYSTGHECLSNTDAQAFVIQAVRDGKTSRHWSEHTIRNMASYLTGCCADYGLLERGHKSARTILPFQLESTVAVYLAYDLHSAGLGDNAVISHPEWGLFGFDRTAVRDELKRVARRGDLLLQTAGESLRIEWRYPSLEELTHVLAQR